jgi:hypothetical protein
VRRGELDIDPSVLEDWGRELRRANGGKVGEPNSTTARSPSSGPSRSSGSSSTPHALGADRKFVRFPSGFADGLQVPGCPTTRGRVNGLGVDLGDSLVRSNGPVSIVIDASVIESRSTTEGTG